MSHKIDNPRDIQTTKEFQDYLTSCGYSMDARGGSHAVYRLSGRLPLSLPLHKTLSPGTKRNLIKILLGESYYEK